MKTSGVGGQAVMEGVMMRSGSAYAVAVRKPDREIVLERGTYVSAREKYPVCSMPMIRGVVTFVESLLLGVKTLTFSSKFFEEEEQQPVSAKKEAFITALTVACSVLIAVGVFMLLPLWLVNLLSGVVQSHMALAVLEGIVRLVIFVGYIVAISQMKDIKRLFMYHGAEHKVINCVEQGWDLTYSNIRKQSRYHKRCGTNFTMIVMMLSVILFIFIHPETLWLRYVLRILLIPLIAGISYEIILLAGKSESGLVLALNKPGLWLQNLTTSEPDRAMIEVAVCALEAVFDWRKFQAEQDGLQKTEHPEENELVQTDSVQKIVMTEYQTEKDREGLAAATVSEAGDRSISAPEREGHDVLQALDRYFEYDGEKTVLEETSTNSKKNNDGQEQA